MRDGSEAGYPIIAGFVIVFAVLYVWQNISVMRVKMECRAGSRKEAELMKKNDRLLYEIERLRRIDLVERYAARNGMVRIHPGNMKTFKVDRKEK